MKKFIVLIIHKVFKKRIKITSGNDKVVNLFGFDFIYFNIFNVTGYRIYKHSNLDKER